MKTTKLFCLATFVLAIPAAHAATTVFSHTFDEGTGGLNGTLVDTGTGSWVAADVVTANGAFATGPGSATLAFTPSNGFEYYLDARVTDVTGDGNWVALGFANGQSTAGGSDNRFITGNVVGSAWMLLRGNNGTNNNVAFVGEGALGGGNNGLTSGENWSAFNTQDGATPGSIDMRVLLDTTAGSGNWTVTWFAKLTTDEFYTTVRPTAAALNEANFTSVGFAFSSGAVDGTLETFSLTAVPEPSATLLGGLGMLALLRRRRR